ncbi:MAG: hypothetical protein Q8L10_01145 [Candidatus Moranbacteria bacterium]|nr:hypothetical protein [Candidatus Moranbacteria bacterium]
MNKIYFISGVNGIGKSTIMPFLSSLLPADKFEIHDFDERGVPENADRNWRISETQHWIDEGMRLAQENKSTVICGFVKVADFPDSESLEIVKIFLDAQPETIRQRLTKRYTNKDGVFDENQKVIGKIIKEFIDGNIYISGQMKEAFEELNAPVVDTTNLTPEETAKSVADIILSANAK